jgi:hypothetical protein
VLPFIVPTVDDPLRSARTKLKRANLHRGTARREFVRFIKKHPSPAFRVENEADRGHVLPGEVVRLDLILDVGLPALPDSFAARFGDAIQNYRNVLDHIAWQLVRHGSDPTPKKPNRVQFPIYDFAGGFDSALSERLPGVSAVPGGVVEFIKGRHRYERGEATNETLRRLRDLTNDDKHKELHLMAVAPVTARHQLTMTNCQPVGFENPPERPKFVADAKIATIVIRVTGPDPTVNVKPNLSIYVALEDWSNALGFLSDARSEATEILNAREIRKGVGIS